MISIVTPQMTVRGFDSYRNYRKIVGKKRAGSAHVFFSKYAKAKRKTLTSMSIFLGRPKTCFLDVWNSTGLPTMSGRLSTFYEKIKKDGTV